MRVFLRGTLTVLAFVLAASALPLTLGGVTLSASFEDHYTPRTDGNSPRPLRRAHDPAKPTAVVVVGNEGAVVSDVLAPYEVLATSGAFNVYAVAPEARPVTLTGGLDLVPDLSFADLDRLLSSAAPDVVVVPALPDLGEPTTRPVTEWLRRQSSKGVLLMSVCNGSGVLASAGLLDGRRATAHWTGIDGFDDEFPAVDWIRGTRYVDDGSIVTTAGILSGIDGALHVTERIAGIDVARRTADEAGWAHYSPGAAAPMTQNTFEAADTVVGFNTAFRWDKPVLGVLLTAGTRELELAAVFDTYGESLAVRTMAVGLDGAPIQSRHGLTFAPRGTPATVADDLDRLIVPGADAAAGHVADRYSALSPVYLHGKPGFPFDAVLDDLVRVTDTATTRWTARILEYPTGHLTLSGPAWPWAISLRPFGLAALGLLAAFGIRALVRRRGQSSARGPGPISRTTR
ncbi:DJ-1/PfpI family protein [Amycolatopsis regifaucium]|uniref:AraC family transcriptional regulator n=1 Tax=Amycolatopsis regifaucium TaxID=546365 RepID=A0A154MP78_9PSEU|nr:DJ-1/PfpI family protein [Amycolatopsis regifaucium]KZB86076.1 AraC family transcriptional regulator [Amycolatopsis regifaucium]OKA04968.1 AraC family transcriptional regulator [Amycolatopsis regifaucium]SFH76957.1 DJ-1/PfpI family protein [Amycolatopsis regifaucium]